MNRIKLEVNKQYLLNTGERAVCVFKSNACISPFLLVVENSHKTFWCNEAGIGEYYVHVTKEFVPHKKRLVFLNVHARENDELFLMSYHDSLDEANTRALARRVGVVSVELINNIETGEMEG